MKFVGSYEAKTHLSQLLDRVAKGEEITITRHGKPVAILVPADHVSRRPEISEVIEQLRAFRKGNTLGRETSIRDQIEEGRRF
jgi:prevent-host-death family protein